MILKSLYLKNYRTYRGPEEINFATGDKNITIIKGNNEVGKTTIMNAITWCLYGSEFYKNEGNEPIWSKSTAYDLEIGDEDKVEVKLTMKDSKGKNVEIIRTLEFYKNDLGNCRKGAVDDKILVEGIPVSFKSTFIAKHFPKKIREYFLFDGEQLESYFKEDNTRIKEAVYKLSQLNLLQKAKNHLYAREKEFSKKLENLNPSLGKKIKEEQQLKEKKNIKENKLNETKKNIIKWESKVTNNEKLIADFGENPEQLIKRKQNLVQDLKKLDSRIDNSEDEYTKFIVSHSSKILSIDYLINVKEICQDLEEKGFIPAQFKKEFLEYLLDQHECICGADLSEGTDAYKKMKELCDKTNEATNISDKVNILLGSVNNIIDEFPKDFKDQAINKKKDIQNLRKERKNIAKEITNIENIMTESDEDEIKKLQESINSYNTLIKKGYKDQGAIEREIENIEDQLIIVSKEIEIEKGKDSEKTDIETSLFFCENARKEINRIYDELEVDIHTKLQELTSFEFENMHWKEFYKGVSIDKDYNVTIHKEGGDIVPNDLSKGGQLVLALSFMTALNSLSGFELPIIIDTPLGRLDEPIKERIGAQLPIYTQNKQVTMLVTSSEYSEGFRKGIRDYVGKEYSLKYIQEKDGITTIELQK